MKKFRRGIWTVFMLAVFCCLSAAAFAAPADESADGVLRWKFATLAPKGIGWARHIESIVLPFVDKTTEGNMKVKVYWGGVMGDDEDYIRKMAIGQIQGAGLSGQGVVMVVPEMGVLELPFMFRSWEEVDYIKEQMAPTFDGLAAERGYFMVAWVDQDFDQLYSFDHAIERPEDLKGIRMMIWYGPVEEELAKVMKSVPVPVNVPEAASATRQKIVDCALGPALWIVGAQVYQVYRFINPMKLRYSPAAIVVTMDAWNSLPRNYRDMMFKERPAMIKQFCEEVRKDNQKCLNAMYSYGVQEAKMKPEDLAAFEKATHPVWKKLSGTMFPKELLTELTDNLDDFRHHRKSAKSATYASVMQAPPAAEPAAAAPASQVQKSEAAAPAPSVPKPEPAAASAGVKVDEAKEGWAAVPLSSRTHRTELVKEVQERLSQEGYYNLAVDGVFGPRTFWGIRSYQKDKGLSVTGTLDDSLLSSLRIL
ncbi:MAG: TRAP transporter substrate-binding protein DctP [Thermodesulfobacteriota bacterium]